MRFKSRSDVRYFQTLSLSLSLSLFLSPSHAPIVKAPHISAMLYACACVHGWVEREAEMVGVT